MLDNIEWLGHSTIKAKNFNKIIYIDPYHLKQTYNDADIIFITHNHYDHFSEEDINRIKKESTVIIIPEDMFKDALKLGFIQDNIISVRPNNNYQIENIAFYTIPAYNINKKFHPKENNWVGYIIELNNIKYYIAGDTDITKENKNVKCDVAFLPVGGTYTMNFEQAATLANEIEPKIAVPIHYGLLIGTQKDAESFKQMLKNTIKGEIMVVKT